MSKIIKCAEENLNYRRKYFIVVKRCEMLKKKLNFTKATKRWKINYVTFFKFEGVSQFCLEIPINIDRYNIKKYNYSFFYCLKLFL